MYLSRPIPLTKACDVWLAWMESIHKSTIPVQGEDPSDAPARVLEIGYKLFPLIEAISLNLFRKNGRWYLKELGYTDTEADIIFAAYRNGQLHTTANYQIQYNNKKLIGDLMGSSGIGGFSDHYPGHKDPNDASRNIPADRALEVLHEDEDEIRVILKLDRLAAHVKYDLNQRKSSAEDTDEVDYIYGYKENKDIRL